MHVMSPKSAGRRTRSLRFSFQDSRLDSDCQALSELAAQAERRALQADGIEHGAIRGPCYHNGSNLNHHKTAGF